MSLNEEERKLLRQHTTSEIVKKNVLKTPSTHISFCHIK